MQAREPQLPGSGHRARALQSGEEWGEESVLPQCQEGGASAVPAGRRFTAPRSWEVTEKKRCALPKDAACSTGGGLASGWAQLLGGPGSSRLIIQPLQGAAVGAGEGQGSEGAVEIRNTPSPRNTRTELALGPRPWGGLIAALCYPRAWAAQDSPSSPPGV